MIEKVVPQSGVPQKLHLCTRIRRNSLFVLMVRVSPCSTVETSILIRIQHGLDTSQVCIQRAPALRVCVCVEVEVGFLTGPPLRGIPLFIRIHLFQEKLKCNSSRANSCQTSEHRSLPRFPHLKSRCSAQNKNKSCNTYIYIHTPLDDRGAEEY